MTEQYLVVEKNFSKNNIGGLDHIRVLLWIPESDRTWYRPEEIQYCHSWAISNNKELKTAIISPVKVRTDNKTILIAKYSPRLKDTENLFSHLYNHGASSLLLRGFRLPTKKEANSFGIRV